MRQKALLLEYFTVGWNVLEGVIALIAGILASSIALIGFGLDSYIEVASAVVLIWRLRKQENEDEEEQAEQRAILVVGVTFIALALYVTYESVTKLTFHKRPAESLVGILLAIVSLIVMPLLAWRKRMAAAQIQSRALPLTHWRRWRVPIFPSRFFWGSDSTHGWGGGGRIHWLDS